MRTITQHNSDSTTVGWEVSAQLQAARISPLHDRGRQPRSGIPAPPGDHTQSRPHQLTEANLAALWRNYAALGYLRLIYTNTVAVLKPDLISRAMSGIQHTPAVFLTATEATARDRLHAREADTQLDAYLTRRATMARHVETTAPPSVCHRLVSPPIVGHESQSPAGVLRLKFEPYDFLRTSMPVRSFSTTW